MENVIVELIKSHDKANFELAVALCNGILRDAIKTICEETGCVYNEDEGEVCSYLELGGRRLLIGTHLPRRHRRAYYAKAGYFDSENLDVFSFSDIDKNYSFSVDSVELLAEIDYENDYDKIKNFLTRRIDSLMDIYERHNQRIS